MTHRFPQDSDCPIEKGHWPKVELYFREYKELWEGFIGNCSGNIPERPYGLVFTAECQESEKDAIPLSYLHMTEASYSVFCNLVEAAEHRDRLAALRDKPYSEALFVCMDEFTSVYDRFDRIGNALDQVRAQVSRITGCKLEKTDERRALQHPVEAYGNYIRHGDRVPHWRNGDTVANIEVRRALHEQWAHPAKDWVMAEDLSWTDVHTLDPTKFPWEPHMDKVNRDFDLVTAACGAEYRQAIAALRKGLPNRVQS